MAKCPYTRKPCMKADCELWDVYPIQDKSKGDARGVIREQGMCTIKWQTKIAFDTAHFQDYMGKSVDKLRTVVKESSDVRFIGSGFISSDEAALRIKNGN